MYEENDLTILKHLNTAWPLLYNEKRLNLNMEKPSLEDLDSKYAKEHSNELIYKVLDNLNEKERKCVISFYLHQKSHKYISDELNIPIGSIGVTITRGLKKMSDLIKKL